MDSLAEFFEEPLGRMAWLALGAVMVLVGLHGLGGVGGLALAVLALAPFAMALTGSRSLMGRLRPAKH